MSRMGTILLTLGLVVITNLATFAYATWRCRQEGQGQERLRTVSTAEVDKLRADNQALQQRFERLRVWGEFIELQQDVNGVHAAINQLNFGTAIQSIDRVAQRLELGAYGQLFRERRAELLPLLDRAKQNLRSTDPQARNALIELDHRAFRILAGNTAPGDFPGPLPSPAPLPTALPEATPALEATPTPEPSPSPQPSPGRGRAAKPTPTPKPGVI